MKKSNKWSSLQNLSFDFSYGSAEGLKGTPPVWTSVIKLLMRAGLSQAKKIDFNMLRRLQ